MSEYLMSTAPQPIVIGASDREEIEQNIRMIIATRAFAVRMDCPFAGEGSYIDSPLPHQTARRIAELTEAVEEYEPRVRVVRLYFSPDAIAARDGKLYPMLRYTMKEGVAL